MKSVLISIRPKWVEKIAKGIKTIEVRKTAPQEVPFKAYIYVTKGKPYLYRVDDDDKFELTNTLRPKVDGYVKDYNEQNGKVIGEFVCDKVYPIKNQGEKFVVANEKQGVTNEIAHQSCLYYDDMVSYFGDKDGYGWHISDLKIYDKPRELSEFFKPCPDAFHYCTICKHCVKIIPPDEEEYALYHGGQYDYWEEHCTNILTSPPQSWMYIEGLREE